MVQVYYFYLCCDEVFYKFFVCIVICVNFCQCVQYGVGIKYQIGVGCCVFYFVSQMILVFEQFIRFVGWFLFVMYIQQISEEVSVEYVWFVSKDIVLVVVKVGFQYMYFVNQYCYFWCG